MTNQQITIVLRNIAATLTAQRTSEADRLLLANLQVANALTLLEQPQYAPFSDPALSQVNGRMEDEIGYSESVQPYNW